MWYRSKPVRFLSTPRPKPSLVHWSMPLLFWTLQGKVMWLPWVAVWSSGCLKKTCWRAWPPMGKSWQLANKVHARFKVSLTLLSGPPIIIISLVSAVEVRAVNLWYLLHSMLKGKVALRRKEDNNIIMTGLGTCRKEMKLLFHTACFSLHSLDLQILVNLQINFAWESFVRCWTIVSSLPPPHTHKIHLIFLNLSWKSFFHCSCNSSWL